MTNVWSPLKWAPCHFRTVANASPMQYLTSSFAIPRLPGKQVWVASH
ncbi:hypothetical protein AQB9606_00100 [Aquabacterium sp. CECT 9606]|nr:hypothetical protein AQB9606_00100 [Aquabacterium sp. CECT 9606]